MQIEFFAAISDNCSVKPFFAALFIFLSGFYAAAQARFPRLPPERPFWFILEEGKKAFREGEYGVALDLFEEARAERRTRYTRMETIFINLLSIGEVRKFNDSLESVEKYIEERNQFDAAAAMQELYYRVGRDALKNSSKIALGMFGRLKEYPEAEYWIGEVYRLEGEWTIALKQYRSALAHLVDEELPAKRIELYYKIAGVHSSTQNWGQMEESLNEILKTEKLWNGTENFARQAMARTLGSEGINRFLQMYRYENNDTEKAHRLLGEFCYKSGRYPLAENHLAFAVMEQNTVLISEAIRKRYNFSFTSLEELMNEISRRKDLKEYMNEVEYFRTLYYLGAALHANGKTAQAKGIWQFLASSKETDEWGRRAQTQLRAPFVEPAMGVKTANR
ncbi:MAG: hypothetical protein Pg6A_13610 [Termitinemataceae bacterium]|nr:MAG: hypothetical protein Pg6A_13610 [Termitinemataceae bacterium]